MTAPARGRGREGFASNLKLYRQNLVVQYDSAALEEVEHSATGER